MPRFILRGVRRALLVGGLGGVMVACGKPPIPPPVPRALVVTIVPPLPAAIEAVTRRWKASDVFQYEVSLRRWDGAGFSDLSPPVDLVLPQKGDRQQEARFANLRQGERYRVDVRAMGNVGGTAPERLLNSEVPTAVLVDLSGAQDVESVRREHVTVSLDPVPFEGTLTVKLLNLPAFVKTVTVDLRDAASGETRYSGTLGPQQTMTLSNLRTGIAYQVRASAYRANGNLHRTVDSSIVRFDPEADALEQARVLEIGF